MERMVPVTPIRSSSMDGFAQSLASVLSCVVESASAGHASDCKASGGATRDPETCQLCLDLKSADEMLSMIRWDDEEG